MNLAQRLLKKALWTLEAIQVNGSAIAMLAGDRVNQRAELGMRYWSWRKLLNILRIEVQLRLGWTKVGGLPFEWEIDTTNICQLQCPLCHTGLGTVNVAVERSAPGGRPSPHTRPRLTLREPQGERLGDRRQ